MQFRELSLPGLYLVEIEPHNDRRGSFARTFCRQEFEAHGLDPCVEQISISRNSSAHTLRGMHYQEAPHGEAKLVRCTRGAAFDVVIDLRETSPTRWKYESVTLTEEAANALYIPEGLAHGFLTLVDHTEIQYQMNRPFQPEAARGIRWNDPAFAIAWPAEPAVIGDRDATFPDFDTRSA